MLTYRQKLGSKILEFHSGMWSIEYSVGSRLFANHSVSSTDLLNCATSIEKANIRGCKTLVKAIRQFAKSQKA